MKQYTVVTNTYTYSELSDAAKRKADDSLREYYREHPISDTVLEEIIFDQKERLSELGIEVKDIWWSLGYVQGDYVTIEGSVDVKAYLKANKMIKDFRSLYTLFQWGWSIWATIRSSGRVGFTVEVESDYRSDNYKKEQRIQAELDSLGASIKEHLDTLNREIYKALREEDMYYFEAENILEVFEYNDYRFNFTEEGKIYNFDEV